MSGDDPAAAPLLAGRYRLLEPVSTDGPTTLWRAVDDVLARPVAVRMLEGATPAAVAAFVGAAREAGALNDRHVVRMYDAAEDGDTAFVATEWCDAPTLADLLQGGPLPAAEALEIVRSVARCVATATELGVGHGALGPASVHVQAGGSVKLRDLAVLAAVAPGDRTAVARRDTRALAELLYAATTGRWPGPPERSGGLPPAPYSDGRLCSVRQVKAGVPRSIDAVVSRVLDPDRVRSLPPIVSPAELLAALPDVLERPAPAAAPVERTTRRRSLPPLVRRGLTILLPLGLLVGVGIAGWVAGTEIGRVPDVGARFPSLPRASTAASPGAGGGAGGPIAVTAVQSFDPLGDGAESPGSARNASDGDESTSWETERYDSSPTFGGLKTGVGLVFDLGSPQAVRSVTVAFDTPGAALELRAGDAASESVDGYRVVAQEGAAGRTVTLRPSGGPARYWVLWLTRLPDADRGYRARVAEVVFQR